MIEYIINELHYELTKLSDKQLYNKEQIENAMEVLNHNYPTMEQLKVIEATFKLDIISRAVELEYEQEMEHLAKMEMLKKKMNGIMIK